MHEPSFALDRVPPRLRRLLAPIAAGESNPGIAEGTGLAIHTVENYISEILEWTGCPGRSRLIVTAIAYLQQHTGKEHPP